MLIYNSTLWPTTPTIESDRCSTGKSNALLRQLEQQLRGPQAQEEAQKGPQEREKAAQKGQKKKKDKKRRRDDDDDAPVVAANVPKEKLDAEDDYYARAAEFRTWLRDAKDLYLDDLAADEARRLFAQFVDRWNAGRLDAGYYSGEAAGRGGKRTRHAWSFKLSDTEARGLASTRAAVSRQSAQDDPTLIRQFDKQPAVVAKPCRPQVKPRDDGAELRRLKVPPRPPGE